MILALVKELENIGFSSEKAFQSIFKVFWEQDPKNSDWKTKFEETFTIDIDTFYASLTSYSTDMSLIYPSSTITVQNIINDTSTISLVSTESTATETTATETTATETTATETTATETTSTETTATETTATETTSTETTSTETTSTETTSNTYSITVTAQSSSNYILSGSDQNGNVSGNDPSISVKAGDTLSFNVNSPGHPFFIIVNSNGGFESNNLPSGITNNGSSTGAVSWTPTEAGTYYYICEYHPSMIGTITITQ
jgi:plastocyanin